MLAVYYVEESGPYKMIVMEVKDESYDSFMEAMRTTESPYPSSDIVFIQDNEVVHQVLLCELIEENDGGL